MFNNYIKKFYFIIPFNKKNEFKLKIVKNNKLTYI